MSRPAHAFPFAASPTPAASASKRSSSSRRRRWPEAPGISGNSTVLTILLKFNDTVTEPYTVEQMQNRMFGAGGVAAYFAEASYGNHTLSGVVTTWLTATVPTPTTCDYSHRVAAGRRPGDGRRATTLTRTRSASTSFRTFRADGWGSAGDRRPGSTRRPPTSSSGTSSATVSALDIRARSTAAMESSAPVARSASTATGSRSWATPTLATSRRT